MIITPDTPSMSIGTACAEIGGTALTDALEILCELIVGDRLRRGPGVDMAAVGRDEQHEHAAAATHRRDRALARGLVGPPDGMTVLNAEALRLGCRAGRRSAGDVLELGVTVAAGAPHAVSTSAAASAPVARARATDGCKVTPSRIAEGSRLSGHRSGHNPSDGDTLRAPRDTAWARGHGSACGADRPGAGHQRLPAQRAPPRIRGRRLVGRLRGRSS